MIPESVLTVIWTMPGFTYVPGDDGFYHVLFMNIVDVGQVTAIRPAYDLTLKKNTTPCQCVHKTKCRFPTLFLTTLTISIYLSLKFVCDADIWNKFYFFQMINRPSLLAASATECRRHNWHKAGKVTLQFSGICNCGLSIWRTTYGGLSPRCPDIEFKVARVSVSKGTVWTCALHWNSQTLRLI